MEYTEQPLGSSTGWTKFFPFHSGLNYLFQKARLVCSFPAGLVFKSSLHLGLYKCLFFSSPVLGLPEFSLWLLFDREDPRESGQFQRTSLSYLGCLSSCLRSSQPDRMFYSLRTAAQPMEMENHTCVEVGGGLGICLSMWESLCRTQGSTSSVFLMSSLLYLLS